MAFLKFLSGKKFLLSESVNVISNDRVPGTNTCVIDNHTVQYKHAVITRSEQGIFRLIDLMTNRQTSLKEEAAQNFQCLEPMENCSLQDDDFIRFGMVVATFHIPSVIESSQFSKSANLSFASANSRFFVQSTQEMDFSLNDNEGFNVEIPEIPETELESQELQIGPSSSSCENSRGSALSVLDFITESDDAKTMFSQNIFGATSVRKKEPDSSDDEDTLQSFPEVMPKASNSREGSITPDLEFNERGGSVTPDLVLPNEVPEQKSVVQQELERADKAMQNIDTQVEESDEDEAKCNPRMLEPTQQLFLPGFRTRQQQKRQTEIKPKTVTLTDFDYTQAVQDGPPSPKKACFALETQPFFPKIPKRAISKAKVVNKILMSSDEECEDESVHVKDEDCSTGRQTPENRSDSPLDFDTGTPDILPQLPSDSQFEPFLEMINASQPSNDSAVEPNEPDKLLDKENIWQPPRPNQEVVVKKKKPRRKIMKYCSDDSDDEPGPSTQFKAKERPKKSCAILISNGTSWLNDLCKEACEALGGRVVESVVDADVLLTQNKIKLTIKCLASICRRIPIVGTSYLEASMKAGGWLDAKLFIIRDAELEERKKISLSAIIQQSKPKIFENYSVLTTANTIYPRDQLIEIIENAGGEFLDNIQQAPTKNNIAVVFSQKDQRALDLITDKYKNILQIVDKSFTNKVFNQQL